ncbi:RNA-guided endonuclease TnpB family protein [Plantactinospora sp. DSM 117369]
MDETVRYTYRLRPGATARAALLAEWGRCRWLWNEAVHQQRTGHRPTFCKLSKLLTETRARSSWLRDGSQVAEQQTLRTYALALQHSFSVKGRGRPRPKGRKDSRPSLEYTVRGFSIRDRRLRLPGGVTIPVVWSRELPSDPTSVRIYQDPLGHWYASFVVRRGITPAPGVEGAIGVDWGVTTTATTTDPAYDLPHHGHRKRCAAELAKLHRRMARRRRPRGAPPSNGYLRAKRQAAKLAKKAARQNTHDAKHRLGLDIRVFRCHDCGYTACRDRNAARTILATAERDRAGADDVRHAITSFLGGALVRSEPEIPRLPTVGKR